MISLSAPSVIDTIVTPPGCPAEGDAYIVAGTGTGDWSGLDQTIVTYNSVWPANNGWVSVVPANGMAAWNEAGRSSNGELIVYSETEDEWYPLQDRWDYSEHWTGRYYPGGEKIMSKVVTMSTWPNATSKTWSIGASGAIDYTVPVNIQGSLRTTSSPNVAFPIQIAYLASGIHYEFRVDNGNLRVVTVFDMTAYHAEVRIEYALA